MSKKPVARCFLNIPKLEGFSCSVSIAEVKTDPSVGSNYSASPISTQRHYKHMAD